MGSDDLIISEKFYFTSFLKHIFQKAKSLSFAEIALPSLSQWTEPSSLLTKQKWQETS